MEIFYERLALLLLLLSSKYSIFLTQAPAPDEDPVVTCPGSFDTGTTPGQSTGIAMWNEPTVTDDIDTGLAATCTPSSGSSFTVGTNNVTCISSADSSGNTGSCSFTITIIDYEGPSVTCPGDITTSAPTSSRVTLTWNDPVVTDNVDSGLSATCTTPSGSFFNAGFGGATNVFCSATDAANNEGKCSFRVTVQGEPVLTCSDTIQSTGTATWSEPTVTDDTDTGLPAICTPPSGSSFTAGTNIVMCNSTDSDGFFGSCTFTVIVQDIESPSVSCTGDISMSTSSSQATVIWIDQIVTDNVDTGLLATCTPSSGSSFSLGSNDVNCSATDSAFNTGTCMFTVNVFEDNVNPSVTCPGNLAMSTSSSQAIVIWIDPTVTDNVDTGLSATCTPSSGSVFNAGTATNVTCSATDVADNEGSCIFVVSIVGSIILRRTITWRIPQG